MNEVEYLCRLHMLNEMLSEAQGEMEVLTTYNGKHHFNQPGWKSVHTHVFSRLTDIESLHCQWCELNEDVPEILNAHRQRAF